MEKIVIIDGKNIRLKATGGVIYRYKQQFGREYIADCVEFQKSLSLFNRDNLDFSDFKSELLLNLFWVFAKTADNSVAPPIEWFDGFGSFPFEQVIPAVLELIAFNNEVDRKNA